jgi:hypothetical protein
MSYSVAWRTAAKRQLARLWVNASDRGAVTAAANAIDAALPRNPLSIGESRWGVKRFLFVPPLAIYYNVYQATRRVIVTAVWQP